MISKSRSLLRELRKAQFNPDIDMSDEAKTYIDRKCSLEKELIHRIEAVEGVI